MMKTKGTKKTLKAGVAALGLAAVLAVPGCATAAAGSAGLVNLGGNSGGLLSALGL